MSTPISPRHNSSLKHKVPVGKVPVAKKHAQKEEKMTEISPSAGKLFAFTIDANTAQVVKLETLDESGGRRELSEEEKASLAHAVGEGADLEEFVEKAFEAGIACVLGEDQHQQGISPDHRTISSPAWHSGMGSPAWPALLVSISLVRTSS